MISLIFAEMNWFWDAAISAVDFEDQDIIRIIQALDINRANDHNNISTHMTKICDSMISKFP